MFSRWGCCSAESLSLMVVSTARRLAILGSKIFKFNRNTTAICGIRELLVISHSLANVLTNQT